MLHGLLGGGLLTLGGIVAANRPLDGAYTDGNEGAGTHVYVVDTGVAPVKALEGAVAGGNWGYSTRPGPMTHWPGGLALAFGALGGGAVAHLGALVAVHCLQVHRATTCVDGLPFLVVAAGGGPLDDLGAVGGGRATRALDHRAVTGVEQQRRHRALRLHRPLAARPVPETARARTCNEGAAGALHDEQVGQDHAAERPGPDAGNFDNLEPLQRTHLVVVAGIRILLDGYIQT